jgi:hypothetical protein
MDETTFLGLPINHAESPESTSGSRQNGASRTSRDLKADPSPAPAMK